MMQDQIANTTHDLNKLQSLKSLQPDSHDTSSLLTIKLIIKLEFVEAKSILHRNYQSTLVVLFTETLFA